MAVLEVESLRKRYGRVVAVHDVSFSVEPGSIFGLLGPNGSGKTTTLACALGLLRPSGGRISILGETPTKLHRTRGRVAAVFDEAILVRGLSVRQQLAYAQHLFGHAGGRSLDESLELVGIAHLAFRSVSRLSLGQRKRMAVAAALTGAPELVVLDEPLSGLDPLGVRDFLRLLRRLAGEGITFVLSSHRLHEMEPVLSHAAVLIAGRVARTGTLEELLTGAGHLHVRVDDAERATRRLEELEDVRVEPHGLGAALRVDPGSRSAAELNRVLVEAGVAVEELSREAVDLPTLFSSLVDELDAAREEVQP